MEKANRFGIASLALVALVVVFLAVESKGLFHYDNADENVYLYMSSLVSEGKLPYRDFFYAHPPLELLFGAAVFRIFGFNLFVLKLIPLAAIAISGVLVFLIARNYFSASAALLSSAFFLFTYRVMAEATYFMGVNIALMFMLFGFFYLLKKPYLAGLFFALAALTRLLVIVPIILLLGFALLKKPKSFLKSFSAFVAVFGIANLFLLWAYPQYFVSVYEFHLLKPAVDGSSWSLYFDFISQNLLLVVAAASAFLWWNKKLILFAIISAASFVFLMQLSRIFNFYFLIALPFLAVIAGVSVDSPLKKVSYQKLAVAVVIVVFIINVAFIANRLWFYDFQDFKAGKEIANYVSENSVPADTIYGDVTSVPLISIFSGRKIAGDLVDTNEMVYLSGVRDLDKELEAVKSLKPKYIITRPLYAIGSIERTQQFLDGNCRLEKHFKDAYWADFLVYGC